MVVVVVLVVVLVVVTATRVGRTIAIVVVVVVVLVEVVVVLIGGFATAATILVGLWSAIWMRLTLGPLPKQEAVHANAAIAKPPTIRETMLLSHR